MIKFIRLNVCFDRISGKNCLFLLFFPSVHLQKVLLLIVTNIIKWLFAQIAIRKLSCVVLSIDKEKIRYYNHYALRENPVSQVGKSLRKDRIISLPITFFSANKRKKSAANFCVLRLSEVRCRNLKI